MLPYDMVQDLQDYDTSSSTISQVRTMEVRSSNRRREVGRSRAEQIQT